MFPHLDSDFPAVLGDHGFTGHLGDGAEHGAALDVGDWLTHGAGHTVHLYTGHLVTNLSGHWVTAWVIWAVNTI